MKPITIKSVGDICLGDSPKCLGFGVKSKAKSRGYCFNFSEVQSSLKADLVFGNLEVVLSDKGLRKYDFESEQLRGSPEMVQGLKFAGFNVINVANNHIMQHGRDAFDETIEVLRNNDIKVVGLRANGSPYTSAPVIVDTYGKKVGFLGYCFEKDRFYPDKEVGYACCPTIEQIEFDINQLKAYVDWLVVSVHWGLEFITNPSPATINLGRDLILAGADIILGHHPHVTQPVEKYENGIICYSLGNFVFDMPWNHLCNKSMIVSFMLNGCKKISFDIIPIIINDNFQPLPIGPTKRTDGLDYDTELQYHFRELPKYNLSDLERENLVYYTKVKSLLFHDMVKSNLFFFRKLFTRTPLAFIPCKLKYFFNKLVNILE